MVKTALLVEMIKSKHSSYLKTAAFLPLIFLIFTMVTLLSSQNPSGLMHGVSVIQTNIYNIWSLILLPVLIVMLINEDYQQENRSLGIQYLIANNWVFSWQYWAKTIKAWGLVLLAQLILVLVTLVSNILTTGSSQGSLLLVCVSLVIWIGSWPLVVINAFGLSYVNAIVVSLINLALSIGGTILNIAMSKWFWLDPWAYALRTNMLLQINPNGTIISTANNDTNFIFVIIMFTTVWMGINFGIAFSLDKRHKE